ncbi:MAG: hypothetical protein RI901_768 [Actinomycetota bacterium]
MRVVLSTYGSVYYYQYIDLSIFIDNLNSEFIDKQLTTILVKQ